MTHRFYALLSSAQVQILLPSQQKSFFVPLLSLSLFFLFNRNEDTAMQRTSVVDVVLN